MRPILLIAFVVLLAGCAASVDRCTADPNLPDCQAARASANATIAAINSERAATDREATRQAKSAEAGLVAQQTQAAAGAKATQIAVSAFSTKAAADANAQATKDALEIQAMNQSLMVSATIAAINVDTARVKASIELSTTQLVGQADVDRSTAQSQAAGPAEWIKIGLGVFVLLALTLTLTRTTQRTTERVGAALATKAENSAAIVRYGPNNSHAGVIDRGPNGELLFRPMNEALAALDYWLPRLAVPDQQKLLAIADYSRRSAFIDGVMATGTWPLIDDGYDNDEPVPQISAAPMAYPYTIVTPSATAQPIAGWLDEVELKLLPSAAPGGPA